jgi:hypothetical protein
MVALLVMLLTIVLAVGLLVVRGRLTARRAERLEAAVESAVEHEFEAERERGYENGGHENAGDLGGDAATAVLTVKARPKPGKKTTEEDKDAAGEYVSVLISAVYLTLLAFLVVVLWQRVDTMNGDVRAESSDLTQIVWDAHRLPEASKAPLRAFVQDYATGVLRQEWPPHGAADADTAASALDTARGFLASPTTLNNQSVLRDNVLAAVNDIGNNRDDRLANAREGIPELILVAFVILSLMAVLIPYLLGPRLTAHGVVGFVFTVSMVTAGALLVINLLHPFAGPLRVDQAPLRAALTTLNQVS